ncbi:MAG: pilus assembly protein N-terminal domain-containing protein [Rhizobiaceae bacterium]
MTRAPKLSKLAGLLTASVIGLSVASVSANAENGIEVVLNQAKILKLARPADTIVVGNPEIADAAVQNSSTIVLTGKGFGLTNLVILDEDGAPIIDEQVFVTRQDARSVRVYRRSSLQTLSCTPRCEAAYKTDAERESDADLGASQ